MSRLGKLSASMATTGVIMGAVAVLTAGVASAATITYKAGNPTPLTYQCTFPAISAQPVAVNAHLDAPDTIPHGTTVTPSNVGGTATISAGVHALLTSVGYDGIRGTATVPVTASAGTLSQPAATGLNIPQTIYPTGGPITVVISQVATSSVPNYTAPAAAGSATLALGGSLTANLEFHKTSNNSWTPYTMNCTLKVTNPAQNTSFSPAAIIS
ncbi:DUF6801 domain-containing protein [Amycolatopsis sp. H20-H5]|uniref:DUF6801 domain-containing protein n=1 Tax=Amycolatopsis sp. H20-H5 TaxID=3046309 RepID=UPI002DBD745E|nr:DUF6801 domain-containing protein [Amycolatopsis sp. H20-H5]MEC3973729.1 DUF6801 domain-containing protein [Amycolatopsis sp. H20-H5]